MARMNNVDKNDDSMQANMSLYDVKTDEILPSSFIGIVAYQISAASSTILGSKQYFQYNPRDIDS